MSEKPAAKKAAPKKKTAGNGAAKKPARLMTKTKGGAKGFPTARPWMISH